MFYRLFLTQFNDVAQYVWGKLLGRRKIAPRVSPNKTCQGFIGGMLITTAFGALFFVSSPRDAKEAFHGYPRAAFSNRNGPTGYV